MMNPAGPLTVPVAQFCVVSPLTTFTVIPASSAVNVAALGPAALMTGQSHTVPPQPPPPHAAIACSHARTVETAVKAPKVLSGVSGDEVTGSRSSLGSWTLVNVACRVQRAAAAALTADKAALIQLANAAIPRMVA
ncbi:MAG: hypothetical protein KC933_35860, partial [Myxococcales bacterium]|nr:hypothetical protein [Myxococcales bacterium]